jgi:hypothetical protein
MMFDIVTNYIDPAMLALLPYRKVWGRKVPVGEIAHWYSEQVLVRARVVPKSGAALRAEVKAAHIATIGDVLIGFVIPTDRQSIGRKARLHRKG